MSRPKHDAIERAQAAAEADATVQHCRACRKDRLIYGGLCGTCGNPIGDAHGDATEERDRDYGSDERL